MNTEIQNLRTETSKRTYGCDDCRYCKGKRCTLWQVKVRDPANSHCETLTLRNDKEAVPA